MTRCAADDLLAELDSLGSEEQSTPTTKAAPKAATAKNEEEDDLFGELEKTLAAKPASTSRPTTPRVSSSTTSGKAVTPASSEGVGSGRGSEEKLRAGEKGDKEGGVTPTEGVSAASGSGSGTGAAGTTGTGGGWWGSMFSAATAAVKQAENLAKEIRGNEEAIKWAEQVKNYGAGLQSLSTDLTSLTLPTFTTLLSHIAPPISAHERLQIHSTHDIAHYPSLDPLIYSVFSRVMAQVEGGDLLVIQRGSEQRSRSTSELQGYRGGVLGSGGGWTDGPWWRDEGARRDLGVVAGLREGTRLARVSAEAYAREFFEGRGGVEAAARKATETLSSSNPVRSSDIFLAVQAIAYPAEKELFAPDAREKEEGKEGAGVVDPTEDEVEDLVAFAIYLHDPIHSLSFSSLSQPFPQKWATWLDAPASASAEDGEANGLPSSIREIIASGGVDPREWVSEWMEEILSLSVGVVAQRYVARRMGVGEGGIGRGKRRVSGEGFSGVEAGVL